MYGSARVNLAASCARVPMPASWHAQHAAPATPSSVLPRQAASKALEGLTAEQRTAFQQQHAALRAQAAAAGVELPELGSAAAGQQRGAGELVLRRGATAAATGAPAASRAGYALQA